jgi:predicted outer membrane protein
MAHVNPVQVHKFLKGVDYPASKTALIENARQLGADEQVCASLQQLPDESFQTPADVSQAFGRLPDDDQRQGADAGAPAQETPRTPRQTRARPSAGVGSNEFLIQAMQDAMAEIQICEMTLEKSMNPDATAFAQTMIDEHGRMGRELEQLAQQKKLAIPQQIRPEQEMTVEELGSLSGRDFEQRWIQYNIDVHERDIKVFQHYAGEEQDPDICALAKQNVETLRRHLKMAHDLGRKMAAP